MSEVVDFKAATAVKTNDNKGLLLDQLFEIIKKDDVYKEATSWVIVPARISEDGACVDVGPTFQANINRPQVVMLLNLAVQRTLGVL